MQQRQRGTKQDDRTVGKFTLTAPIQHTKATQRRISLDLLEKTYDPSSQPGGTKKSVICRGNEEQKTYKTERMLEM